MKKETIFKMKNFLDAKKHGFTLIELLIVIAIIGILAGVVLVNSGQGVERSKHASALSTMASVLPEMVACQDDGFGLNAFNVASTICDGTGHTALWPNLNSKTGYTIVAAEATNAEIGTYSFTATKTGQATITCSYDTAECN